MLQTSLNNASERIGPKYVTWVTLQLKMLSFVDMLRNTWRFPRFRKYTSWRHKTLLWPPGRQNVIPLRLRWTLVYHPEPCCCSWAFSHFSYIPLLPKPNEKVGFWLKFEASRAFACPGASEMLESVPGNAGSYIFQGLTTYTKAAGVGTWKQLQLVFFGIRDVSGTFDYVR